MELTPYQIVWVRTLRVWPGGSASFATNDTLNSHLAHQLLYRAAGDIQAFAFELIPDLARPIDAEIIILHSTDVIV